MWCTWPRLRIETQLRVCVRVCERESGACVLGRIILIRGVILGVCVCVRERVSGACVLGRIIMLRGVIGESGLCVVHMAEAPD